MLIAKTSQKSPTGMTDIARSHVSYFMKKFCKAGFIAISQFTVCCFASSWRINRDRFALAQVRETRLCGVQSRRGYIPGWCEKPAY